MGTFLFSDKLRLFKLLLVSLMIAGLVWWGANEAMRREVTFVEAVEEIEVYQSEEFTFAGRIISKEEKLVTVRERGMEVLLSASGISELIDIPEGKVVSGRGVLTTDGRISVAEFHYHRYHEVKLWLSLIISVLMFVWFWRKFKFSLKQSLFVEKDAKS